MMATLSLTPGRPLILDGAMGTELQRRGASVALPLWSAAALVHRRELVSRIHHDYLAAGADILTTNTFRTTERTFRLAGLPDRSAELTTLAVTLAARARAECGRPEVLLAGSIAPLEDCYQPDLVPDDAALEREHQQHASRLADAGVDLLLCETMGTVRESIAAAKAARATALPWIVSFLCNRAGALYGGEPLEDALRAIVPLRPAALAVNCLSPASMERPLELLARIGTVPFGVYGNVGIPGQEKFDTMLCDVDADAYAGAAVHWADLGAAFIGGCCGTTPEYIRTLRARLAATGHATPRNTTR